MTLLLLAAVLTSEDQIKVAGLAKLSLTDAERGASSSRAGSGPTARS